MSEIAHRLDPAIPTAMEIAVLVKTTTDFSAAANLIEQYAQTVAAEARLDATVKTADRLIARIGGSHA